MSSDKKNTIKPSSVLSQWKNRKKKTLVENTIALRPAKAIVQPSSGQQRLWLLQQLYPKNPFYQYGHLYKIKGNLDLNKLQKSFQYLINKHEIFRTNFVETPQGLELKIRDTYDFFIEEIDRSTLSTVEKESAAYKSVRTTASNTFDLTNNQLLRVSVIKLSAEEYWMVLSIHHIIGDRTSLLILQKELFDFYKKNTTTPISIEPNSGNMATSLPIQYADYAFWKNNQAISEQHLNYWLNQLSGNLPLLNLPLDYPRPKQPSFKGATISKKLSFELSTKIQALAKAQETTRYVVLLTAFKILLHRYSGQQDILVGSPFSNRDKVQLENLIGFFNETVVLRSAIKEEISFQKFITEVKEITANALAHKNVPFDELVRKLQPKRYGSANPLFQAMFVYNNSSVAAKLDAGLEIQEEIIDFGVSKFDLTLFATDHGEQLEIAFEFALDLFEKETVERLLNHLENLLTSGVTNPEQTISQLPILAKKEQHQLLVEWNDTKVLSPPYVTIHQLIEEMAVSFPERTAVVCGIETITYAVLNKQAEIVAASLLQHNLQPSSPVGLYTHTSITMVVGMLGILKASGAYLPLDPAYPKERIDFILQNAKAGFILCQKEIANQLTTISATILPIEDLLSEGISRKQAKTAIKPTDLAYIIYTSGSVGKPKGVPITHQNLIHSTTARFHFFDQQPSAFLLLSSFAFDSSIVGLFWTLCKAGTLVLPPKRIEQDLQALAKIIKKNNISHTLLLPSLYNLLLKYTAVDDLRSLKTVIVAGETCATNLVLAHYNKIPRVELVNEYGPTEGTVWCTAHHIQPVDAFGIVPIGRPIPNVENFILDKNLQPVPIGVIGELYIGGKGVANGYWNRPALTKERFIPHPFKENKEKLYKTGDLVKYRKNGVIEFLGRADHQVKIRGHRIELTEIEAGLKGIDGIEAAIVKVQNQRLIAYLIKNTHPKISDVRTTLKTIFPDYMIPAIFIQLAEFPKLPNGKIDVNNLPAPTQKDISKEMDFVAPSTELEQELATIWEQVLKITPISVHHNFFEIGGDSIQSIQVIAKARKIGIKLAPNQLFEYQTIAELATFLEKQKASSKAETKENANWSSLVSLNKKGSKPPLFCIHSGGGHVFFYRPLAKHLPLDQPLYALQPKGLDGKETLHNSIEEMAHFYIQEMKKVQPTGPYHLLGTCFSNAVGLEMANQLKANGDKIALLIFVDSGPQYLLGADIRGEHKTMSRFVKMIKEKNWSGIQKKFRNRFIRTKQKALVSFENEQETNLRLTISNLNKLYHYYSWTPFDGNITFIRSTEFANRADKNIHIQQWEKLAKGDLTVHIVEGHHKTLFGEHEVKGLAKTINQCILATTRS